MAPMDVQRVTHGAKGGFGTPWYRTILTSAVGLTEAMKPPTPCVAEAGVGPL